MVIAVLGNQAVLAEKSTVDRKRYNFALFVFHNRFRCFERRLCSACAPKEGGGTSMRSYNQASMKMSMFRYMRIEGSEEKKREQSIEHGWLRELTGCGYEPDEFLCVTNQGVQTTKPLVRSKLNFALLF